MSDVSPQNPDFDRFKAPIQSMWDGGDYEALHEASMPGEGEAFVARLPLRGGERVLDVACGMGSTALPLARRGLRVTGLDPSPNMLKGAQAHASAEQLPIQFEQGFAEELPFADASFDAVVSMFGVMFAVLPDKAVQEMARVLKPGGTLALASWTPDGFSGRMRALSARFVPPPPPLAPPLEWGDAAAVREHLAASFDSIETSLRPVTWTFDDDAVSAARFFIQTAGPMQMMLARCDAETKAAMLLAYERFFADSNEASDTRTQTVIRNAYLDVTAVRRRDAGDAM